MTVQLSELRFIQRIGVIIPVYGDGDSACWVLSRFRNPSVTTICMIVDAPRKETMDQIREAAKRTGVTVHIIKNPRRRGIGFSLRQGLAYLSSTAHEIVVVMAGNGKDDPAEIDRLIEPVATGKCDYVQGSRYLNGGRRSRMPFFRMIFNRVYPLLWSLLTRKRCTDVTNGYRCFNLDVLGDHRVNLNQSWLDGYSLEYYLLYKVLTLGYEVREVPVSKIYYRFGNNGAYTRIHPIKDFWPILSPLILLFLGAKK